MGAADLDDLRPLLRFVVQRVAQLLQGRQQAMMDLLDARDVHGRRIGVVRRLAHIDVIVWMNRFLRAHFAAEHFNGTVGNHLVGIHVGLRTRARLPDDQREVGVELALDDFLRRLDDGLAKLRVEPAKLHVDLGRGALDDAQRPHDRCRLLLPADLEIAERALRLRAPVSVAGNLDRAERVGLGPECLLGHVRVSGILMSATAYPVARTASSAEWMHMLGKSFECSKTSFILATPAFASGL